MIVKPTVGLTVQFHTGTEWLAALVVNVRSAEVVDLVVWEKDGESDARKNVKKGDWRFPVTEPVAPKPSPPKPKPLPAPEPEKVGTFLPRTDRTARPAATLPAPLPPPADPFVV